MQAIFPTPPSPSTLKNYFRYCCWRCSLEAIIIVSSRCWRARKNINSIILSFFASISNIFLSSCCRFDISLFLMMTNVLRKSGQKMYYEETFSKIHFWTWPSSSNDWSLLKNFCIARKFKTGIFAINHQSNPSNVVSFLERNWSVETRSHLISFAK